MEIWQLIAAIIVIAALCVLLEVPEKFQKLLYFICAALIAIAVVALVSQMMGHPLLRG